AFVEPCLLKLIRGNHTVPVLVAKFVRNDRLRQKKTVRQIPCGICGDQRWILHATGAHGSRIHDRELLVRIRPIPAIKYLHRALGDRVVTRAVCSIFRLHQCSDVNRARAPVECIVKDPVPRISGPSEIVNILRLKNEGLGAVRVVHTRSLYAGSAHDLVLRKRKLYLEYSEVSEEFGGFMKLVAIPTAVPPYTHLGKPLGSHREGSLVSGSRNHLGKLVVELDAELNRLSWSNCSWKLYLRHSAVVWIVIVRGYELQSGSLISLANDFEFLDIDRAYVARLPLLVAIVAVCLMGESGIRLKAIEIEGKRKNRKRLTGQILVGEDLGRVQCVRFGIVRRVDVVPDDAVRQRSIALRRSLFTVSEGGAEQQCHHDFRSHGRVILLGTYAATG